MLLAHPRSHAATACVLSGVSQHKLSDLLMAANCVWLGGAQVRPRCEPRPTVAGAGPGATKQEVLAY